MPATVTLEEAEHFSMFTMKAVLDGRAGQLIDLSATALVR